MWVLTFTLHCLIVKSLAIDNLPPDLPLHRILENCSGRLDRLTLSGVTLNGTAVAAISRHCSGLQEMTIDTDEAADLRAMWDTIGPSPEKFSFRIISMTRKECDPFDCVRSCFSELLAACSRILEFTMHFPFQSAAKLFCLSLEASGNCFQSINMYGEIDPESIASLAITFPAIEIGSCVPVHSSTAVLQALRARAYDFRFWDSFKPNSEFEVAADRCVNLSRISFDGADLETTMLFRALLSHSKPKLKDLCVSF